MGRRSIKDEIQKLEPLVKHGKAKRPIDIATVRVQKSMIFVSSDIASLGESVNLFLSEYGFGIRRSINPNYDEFCLSRNRITAPNFVKGVREGINAHMKATDYFTESEFDSDFIVTGIEDDYTEIFYFRFADAKLVEK